MRFSDNARENLSIRSLTSRAHLMLWYVLVRVAFRAGMIPFYLNEHTKKIAVSSNGCFRIIWHTQVLLSLTLLTFNVGRLLYFALFSWSFGGAAAVTIATLCYGRGMVYLVQLIREPHTVAWFVNNATTFYETTVHHFSPEWKKKYFRQNFKNGGEGFVRTGIAITALMSVSFIRIAFFKPRRAHLFTSVFQNPSDLPWPIFGAIAGTNWLVGLAPNIVSYIYAFYLVQYCYSLLTTLRALRKYVTWRSATAKGRVSGLELWKLLRTMEVLQLNFNSIFGKAVLPATEIFYLALIVAGVWGAIRIPVMAYRIFWFLAAVWNLWAFSKLYRCMGLIYEESKGLLLDIRQVWAKDLLVTKFLLSIRPLRITHGSLFYIDKLFILTFWGTVVDFTVSLLLTTEKK